MGHHRGKPCIAISISDIHACGRWMPLERIAQVVAQTNALCPDLIALPGDFLVGRLIGKRPIAAKEIAETLSGLRAPTRTIIPKSFDLWLVAFVASRSGSA